MSSVAPPSEVLAAPLQGAAVNLHEARSLATALPRLEAYAAREDLVPLSRHPRWLRVLEDGLGHRPYCLEAVADGETRGWLPLAFVRSILFGRFLVSLPYVNYGGVHAEDPAVAAQLVERAVELARELDVRYLELRHERAFEHPALTGRAATKAHARLPLPATPGALWDLLDPKVRNQVRKGQKSGLAIAWGRHDLLPEFHAVFSHNMRDLGTPVYGQRLFRAILDHFPDQAEICVARLDGRPVAAALLLHGRGVTEVPSASSLRQFNSTCANMLVYWNLLERAIGRGQRVFDFGRSTVEGPTFRFKKQWGAEAFPAEWQYHVRQGTVGEMRPENPRYGRLIRLWRKLPVSVTRVIGPPIVRGIP